MYGYPQLGDASGDAAMCAAQGNDLAKSLKLAVGSGNTAAADMFRAQLKALNTRCAAASQKANAKDMPSKLALAFADIGTQVARVFEGAGLVSAAGLGIIAYLLLSRGRK